MRYDKIEELLLDNLRESAKVLHMDDSHSALRDKLQRNLAVQHRVNNPDGDYYSYPSVQDVYGDGDSGSVVYSQGGKHTMASYKSGKDNSVALTNHKPVKRAYVTTPDEKTKESAVFVDGAEVTLAAKESGLEAACEEVVDLREAAFDEHGHGSIKLISPGHGSTGYYSPEVLKEAAKNKVFDIGTQMLIDHPTEEEDAARPEGSVKKLAAKFTSAAAYQEAGSEGPGLYARVQAYPDFKDFLNARASDIGVSIRALGKGVQGQVGGRVNRIVKSLNVVKTVDFVNRAGAGGKLVPLFESFRESASGTRNKKESNNMAKVEIEDTVLAALQESVGKVPQLQLQIDRGNERFARLDARELASGLLKESELPAPAQTRLLKRLIAPEATLPLKEGLLDVAKFTEAVKAAVTDEAAYLKESGAVRPIVNGLGAAIPATEAEEKALQESNKAYDTEFTTLIGGLSGVKRGAAK